MRPVLLLAAALLVLLPACGPVGAFACDIVDKSGPTEIHRCSELDLLDATQQQDAQDACPLLGGVVVATCSTQGQIGVCKLVSEGAKQTIHFC